MSQQMLETSCPKCGHINYFNLQRLCTGSEEFVRLRTAGLRRADHKGPLICELVVTCQSAKCGHTWTIEADCGAYL